MARRWSLVLDDSRLSLDIVGLLPDPVPGCLPDWRVTKDGEPSTMGTQIQVCIYTFSRGRALKDLNLTALDPA